MNRDEATEYLKTHRHAVLATIKRDGRSQLSNVSTAYVDGVMLISITQTRAKYANLRRDPRASLLVLGDSFWQYLVVEGTVTLTLAADALPELRKYYELASGQPHPNWDEYDQAMIDDRRVLVRLSIDRLYPLDGE